MKRQAAPLSLGVLLLSCVACDDHQAPPASYPDCIERPSAQSPAGNGCGNVFVYQWLDVSRVLTVSVDQRMLRLTTACTTLDLSAAIPGVHVALQVARADPDSSYFSYCNDVLPPNFAPPDTWNATSGTLSISASEDGPPTGGHSFRVTVKLTNVRFTDPRTQNDVQLPELVIWDVGVGWLPG